MDTLKRIRKQRMLSIRDLAGAAGVSPSTVFLAEHGKFPKFVTRRKLSSALGLAPNEIDWDSTLSFLLD